MEILLVAQYYPPETGALAVRASDHTRRWVRAADVRATVVSQVPSYPTGRLDASYDPWRVTEGRDGRVRTVRVPAVPARYESGAGRFASYMSFAVSATTLALPHLRRPDVVLASSPPLTAAAAGRLLARRFRVPFVLELRDLWPEAAEGLGVGRAPGLAAGMRRLADHLYAVADRIVVVTPGMADALVRKGVAAGRIEVVANGVDLDRFRPSAEPHPVRAFLPQGATLAGAPGNQGIAQGLEVFVEALARPASPPSLHGLLVGAGARGAALRELVARIVPQRCTFLPPVPHAEMPALWAALDIAVVTLSPNWDPRVGHMIPSKIYEAMAAGRPVVMAGHGEGAELVARTGAGLAVPPAPGPLADALRLLALDSSLREEMGRAGRAYVESHHDRDALAASLLAVLRAAASGR